MREYFRGWRRKFGVVTLLMACGLSAAWIRSRSQFDAVFVDYGIFHFSTISHRGGVTIGSSHIRLGVPIEIMFNNDPQDTQWAIQDLAAQNLNQLQPLIWIAPTIPNARIYDETLLKDSYRETLPYWSIVIPITLLSASLLLSKPRTTELRPPAE